MSIASMIAIYFLIWWLTLFAVLPWGLRTHGDEEQIVEGVPESAPFIFKPWTIILRTTCVSLIIFAIIYYVVVFSGLTLDDIPF